METALFRADLADGPEAVRAHWVRTSDDVQIRVVVWPVDDAVGTVLLLPGRTEYAEKYGRVAGRLTAAGLTVATLDWRGQGLSDRMADDRLLGHVLRFTDYQNDLKALLEAVVAMGLTAPRFLIAHSMGGTIGFRALSEGLEMERAVFTAPMWGIAIPRSQRAFAAVLPALARLSGQGERYVPGSKPVIYDPETGFDQNPLTTDPEHFAWFSRQLQEEKQFALGPPSVHWLGEAMAECRNLRALPLPEVPALTFLGTDETVVSVPAIETIHGAWPGAELRVFEGARHEIMMEVPAIRDRFFDETLTFLGVEGPG